MSLESLVGDTDNSYLYTGEQYDPNMGQYYLRARYYNQGVGRFTQMDTWQGKLCTPISLNKYIYGNMEPTRWVDPSGNIAILAGFTINHARASYTRKRSADRAFSSYLKVKQKLCNVSTAGLKEAHHAWPMFLGGMRNQDKVNLPKEFHRQFHQLLHYMLRFNGFAGGFGKGSSRAAYEELFAAKPEKRSDAHKILIQAAKLFDNACKNKGVRRVAPEIEKQIKQGKWDF